ncbi:MAG: class I SAM-dependent methyltransferase [Phycisphaerales bacterium JB065]
MSDAPPLTLQRFPLASPPGESLELWLPSDPDDRVRRAQREDTPGSDLLGFWATLWPAARTTAHLVGTTNLIDPSTRILELGCGVGLAGLAAAKRGATVTLTDGDPSAIDLLDRNIAHNDLTKRCTAAVFRWEDPPDPSWQPDLILGCDVLYHHASHPLLADLIRTLNCTALLTDPQRPSAAAATATFRDHGLSVWETTAPPAGGGCALRVLVVQPN